MESDMTQILQFRRPDERPGRSPIRRAELRRIPAEIVIFPGVRIEREAPTPPRDDLDGGKRRKAGGGRKH
jgi:hypothetical protein